MAGTLTLIGLIPPLSSIMLPAASALGCTSTATVTYNSLVFKPSGTQAAPSENSTNSLEERYKEELGDLVKIEAKVSAKLVRQQGISLLNEALNKGLSGNALNRYMAGGTSGNLFRRNGISSTQQAKLTQLIDNDTNFQNLMARIEATQEKGDKQLILAQRLLDKDTYNNDQTPVTSELLAKLTILLKHKAIEVSGQEMNVNMAVIIESEQRIETLKALRSLSTQESKELHDLQNKQKQYQNQMKSYLHKGIAELVSAENTNAKHEHSQLFDQLDLLAKKVLILKGKDNSFGTSA